jgi:hypothetical protein
LCFRDAGAVNRLWKKYTGTKVYWILQYTIPVYWCSVAVSDTYCSSLEVCKYMNILLLQCSILGVPEL